MSNLSEETSYLCIEGREGDRQARPTVLQLEYEGMRPNHLNLWVRDREFEEMVMIDLPMEDVRRLADFLNTFLAALEASNEHDA